MSRSQNVIPTYDKLIGLDLVQMDRTVCPTTSTILYHRVDSVIESSLREIIGNKNFALINLSLNFCETTIYDNKVFLENLVAVH